MRLQFEADNRAHAMFCAVVFLLCALLTKPYVEMGISDDFSYVRSAQVLAQTGHIVYNGWATAMLGWQLYLGALFIRLFGFPFTSARASIVVLSALTTYLLHRVMTRFGLSPWNATLATLMIVLSPVWLLMEVTFMSDAPGLFCVVLCLYACQKSILLSDNTGALWWLWFAGVSNIVDGTARQTGWLGVLVIVPATAWLLRRRKGMIASGAVLWLAGVVSILWCLHWFKMQPYSDPSDTTQLLKEPLGWERAIDLGNMLLRSLGSLPLMALPVMVIFFSGLKDLRRRKKTLSLVFILLLPLAVLMYGTLMLARGQLVPVWLFAPWIGDNVTLSGVMQSYEIVGHSAILLRERSRMILTIAVLVSSLCLIAHLAMMAKALRKREPQPSTGLSWSETNHLLIPFALAYTAALVPRASVGTVFDRYLIPLVMVMIVYLLRYVQEQFSSPSYVLSLIALSLFSYFAVAGTHDLFAFDRARLQAADEVTRSGIPRTALEAGFEYDDWTQILACGYLPPATTLANAPGFKRDPCRAGLYLNAPAVKPDYIISFDPKGCYPESKYPAVPYHTWLPPHQRAVYIQQVH